MNINPIAHIQSPYKQKFAIPRQPGLVKAARGEIIFEEAIADPNCLREISQFSHLWLIFHFHETSEEGWSPLVQPPRLGGREKVGVFASRSTFRPNSLGMSVVENLGWTQEGKKLVLRVGGVDLLDKTPIIDIKPYVPYADAIPGAQAGYASDAPGNMIAVEFTEKAKQALEKLTAIHADLQDLIEGVLQQDPRPAWRHKTPDEKQYGMSLYDLNIRWRVEGDCIRVLSITDQEAS
ncbi:MAG: tRNA (N6-threonylcarbamoyladenosine(37)-N6)-methyltransferase TrmO [Gammaproteobacteria bacterium]|nr:tRNA (N6-threonylcarbamoyladenosine(37)-N6)-methyltransferase TrmO [Gammaproteobacteria bacterium]